MAFEALNEAEIQALLSGERKRKPSIYEVALNNFVQSGDAGVKVDLTQGEFIGKSAQNVVNGFRRYIKEGNVADVKAIANGDQAFLVRTA